MLVVVHTQSDENVRLQFNGVSNNILQIYNPAIFYCHLTSLCLLAIFKTKYQMLVVAHPQSDENVRLRWGFRHFTNI